MKILFHLPRATLSRVFAADDLARLAAHELVYPADVFSHQQDWAIRAPDAQALVTGWGTPHITDQMLDQARQLRVLVHSAGTTKYLLPPTFWSRGLRLGTANEALGI